MDIASIAWAGDNNTVFFCTEDESKRPYRVYRQTVDARAPPDLVWEETDRAFNAAVGRTRSKRFVVIASASAVTADAHCIPADQPTALPECIAQRIDGQEYYVDDGGGDNAGDGWFILANDTGRNFRLVTAPVASSERGIWTEVIAHRGDIMIEDHACFSGHVATFERAGGLPRLERDESCVEAGALDRHARSGLHRGAGPQ